MTDEHHFKAFIHITQTAPKLQHSDIKLHNLHTKLPVKGCFDTTVRNVTCGFKTQFAVLEGRIQSPPLLSRDRYAL